MDDLAGPLDQQRATRLLAVVLALVVYGSLYPFSFSTPGRVMLAWDWRTDLPGLRDALINIALYFPVGFLLACTIRSRSRILIATLVAAAMSGAIEVLQSFEPQRVSSLSDLLLNIIGGAFGAWLASRLSKRIENPAPMAIILLTLLARTYPFFPNLHPHWSAFRLDQALFAGADWLAVRYALAAVCKRTNVTRELAILQLAIPAGSFVLDQTGSLSDAAGAVLALAIGHLLLNRPVARPAQFAPVMLLTVIARELLPAHLSAAPQPFHWIPFETYIGGPPALAALFVAKLAVYSSALWLLDPESRHVWGTAPAVGGLVFVLEWLQRYLPGRTPDVTEPILVLIAATLL